VNEPAKSEERDEKTMKRLIEAREQSHAAWRAAWAETEQARHRYLDAQDAESNYRISTALQRAKAVNP
jgi:hypothetical protein